jgi:hypothetical protein
LAFQPAGLSACGRDLRGYALGEFQISDHVLVGRRSNARRSLGLARDQQSDRPHPNRSQRGVTTPMLR